MSSFSEEDEPPPPDPLFRPCAAFAHYRAMALAAEQESAADDSPLVASAPQSSSYVVGPPPLNALVYDSYLSRQVLWDDLKHVDFKYLDFGDFGGRMIQATRDDAACSLPAPCSSPSNGFIIEQRKQLGKGGLVWDAAVILAEYLMRLASSGTMHDPSLSIATGLAVEVVELGAGTGLVGLALARFFQASSLPIAYRTTVTDLPELMGLISSNASLNFPSPLPLSSLRLAPLTWGSDDLLPSHSRSYDVVVGADVVASLYDPVALARCIWNLCHEKSVAYISFKGREDTFHNAFEEEVRRIFMVVDMVKQGAVEGVRNMNPGVGLIILRQKKPLENIDVV